MDLGSVAKRLIFCAGLAALAAPLRAAEAEWLSSADLKHVIRVPAGWLSAAAAPLRMPQGIRHVFSLAPKSRAFTLDIAAEYALATNAAAAEGQFTKVLKLAGNPRPLRAQLSDNSMFQYFRSAAGKGRAGYRVQGVLHKYVQRYYLTFSSARDDAGEKEWKEAMAILASLEPSEPSAGGWTGDFLKKVTAGAGLVPDSPAAAGSLKHTGAFRADGTRVSYEDIAIFGCSNFIGNLYLFNEDWSDHCWIAALEDYKTFLGRLDERFWRDSHPSYQDCPGAMKQERACDPEKLRRF